MFLGILSAIALGFGVAATANDLGNTDVMSQANQQPVVQVEQIQQDTGSGNGELSR